MTTIPENLTTWTIARFAVMSLRINILKLRGFSVKSQLCYLTNQLHVSDTVLYPSQEYREKRIIQLQYRPEISDRTVCYIKYVLTPWCRVLLEKLTGLQLVKKFPSFLGTRRFITALTNVRHLSLSWASPIQSIYPHSTSWRSIIILSTHLHLGLPSGLFPSGFVYYEERNSGFKAYNLKLCVHV